jgi:hypothetical protein
VNTIVRQKLFQTDRGLDDLNVLRVRIHNIRQAMEGDYDTMSISLEKQGLSWKTKTEPAPETVTDDTQESTEDTVSDDQEVKKE